MRNILFKTDDSIQFSNMLTSVAVKTRCHTENLPTLDRHIFKKKDDDDDHDHDDDHRHHHHHHPLYRVHVRVPHGQTIQKKNYELKKKYYL